MKIFLNSTISWIFFRLIRHDYYFFIKQQSHIVVYIHSSNSIPWHIPFKRNGFSVIKLDLCRCENQRWSEHTDNVFLPIIFQQSYFMCKILHSSQTKNQEKLLRLLETSTIKGWGKNISDGNEKVLFVCFHFAHKANKRDCKNMNWITAFRRCEFIFYFY